MGSDAGGDLDVHATQYSRREDGRRLVQSVRPVSAGSVWRDERAGDLANDPSADGVLAAIHSARYDGAKLVWRRAVCRDVELSGLGQRLDGGRRNRGSGPQLPAGDEV